MRETLKTKLYSRNIALRWVTNVLSVIVCVFLVCFVVGSTMIHTFYYAAVEKHISAGSTNAIENYFKLNLNEGVSFADCAADFLENYTDKDQVEVWAISAQGDVIGSSSGFKIDKSDMLDYDEALAASDKNGKWVGKLSDSNREKVMAYTYIIEGGNASQTGAIRFICSLDAVDQQIYALVIALLSLLSFLLLMVVLSNHFFIKSIIKPVKNISETAKKIAAGDFNARIKKTHYDELGDLGDVINNMAEEVSTTDSMKNDFISTISHELRTPLTSIKGWGETLITDPFVDPQLTHRGLEVIINESGRLAGFVEELLDFSHMQSGRMTLRLDIIDVLAELDETVFVFKERALREGIEVQYNAPDVPVPTLADANRIKQVFVNILDNALKYNNEGGRVFISAEIENQSIKIIVADNGCGISVQDLPHIKEKFYKANISVRGSGIGLAVAEEIVQLHGGILEIESVENEGTTVHITLPLATTETTESERKQTSDE